MRQGRERRRSPSTGACTGRDAGAARCEAAPRHDRRRCAGGGHRGRWRAGVAAGARGSLGQQFQPRHRRPPGGRRGGARQAAVLVQLAVPEGRNPRGVVRQFHSAMARYPRAWRPVQRSRRAKQRWLDCAVAICLRAGRAGQGGLAWRQAVRGQGRESGQGQRLRSGARPGRTASGDGQGHPDADR
ncbi:hypothetical protein D3C81_1364060 [compost metagenome]